MKKILLLGIIFILLAACSENTYDKALEDAKFALANGEYEQALGLYELAHMENPDDSETKAMFEALMQLHDLNALAKKDDWANVILAIETLKGESKVPAQLDRQFQQLYEDATDLQNKQIALEGILKEADSLIAKKEFDRAQSLLDVQKADPSFARVVEKNETAIISLYGQIEKGIEELGVQEKQKEVLAESSQDVEKLQTVGNQAKYTDKLNQIEHSLKELDYLYVDGVTSKILEAEIETFEKWDDALNEIYGVLKTSLSASEMDSLRNEQRDWILYRDHEAEVAAAEFKGGTFEAVTLVSVKQQLTKDRCYTMVQTYME